MTDIQLVLDIAEELRTFLRQDEIRMPLRSVLKELSVYEFDLPFKEDADDEKLQNYIVVTLGDQDTDGDEWEVEVHLSICITDTGADKGGFVHVLYLMNEIYRHFVEKGVVGEHCRMGKEAHKRLNMELLDPYYEGDLITSWRLPIPNELGLEELI